MKKELFGIIMVLTVVVIVFAGCLGNNNEDKSENESDSFLYVDIRIYHNESLIKGNYTGEWTCPQRYDEFNRKIDEKEIHDYKNKHTENFSYVFGIINSEDKFHISGGGGMGIIYGNTYPFSLIRPFPIEENNNIINITILESNHLIINEKSSLDVGDTIEFSYDFEKEETGIIPSSDENDTLIEQENNNTYTVRCFGKIVISNCGYWKKDNIHFTKD